MTTNTELNSKLDEILTAIHKMETANAERDAQRAVIKEKVDKHQEILEGNGKTGLKTEVVLLKDQVARLIAVGAWIAGITGVQLVTIIFGFLTHTLKFTP